MISVKDSSMHVYLMDSPDKGVGTAAVSGSLIEEPAVAGQGGPVVNAPVYLADARDGCYISAGLTDAHGKFCFTHLLTGEYCLKVEHRGNVLCDESAILKIDRDGLQIDVKATLSGKNMSTTLVEARPAQYLNPLDRGISFNPNPSPDGRLNLELKEPFPRLKLEISDMAGWIVKTMDLKELQAGHTDAVDLEDLQKGTYILELSTNRDRLSKQLVLQ